MSKALRVILCLAALAVTGAGCSKCGPFWEDGPHACRAEAPR
ncbi:MAG TPA: hypothetical protein VFB31_01325 [Pseudolabrys sp.]|nr:hypothetical protein [Pseudolabrys sp.]